MSSKFPTPNPIHPVTLNVNPSTTLIIPLSRVVGGKLTVRERVKTTRQGEYAEEECRTTVVVQNAKERALAEAIVDRAIHAIRSRATSTLLGYLTDAKRLPEIHDALEDVREDATTFNSKPGRTCHIEISALTLPISVAIGKEAAEALGDHIRHELGALRQALRLGNYTQTRAVLHRAKNLHQLAVGMQAEAIAFALQEGHACMSDLKAAGAHKSANPTLGEDLDLAMIEAALGLFQVLDPIPRPKISEIA